MHAHAVNGTATPGRCASGRMRRTPALGGAGALTSVAAEEVGCGGDNVGANWDHMCIVVYKTSRTGQTTFMHPSTRLTPEAHEHAHKQEYGGYRQKPADILPHLQKIVKAQVKDAQEEL